MPVQSTPKRVGIIGGGPSGLVTAKNALANGLVPVIFERKSTTGGLWSPHTAVWNGLHTNVSKFSVSFSDFPWDETSSMFPSDTEMADYFHRYEKHFKIDKNAIHLNANVDLVKQMEDKKWQLTWTNLDNGDQRVEIFEYLVCATGLHNVPHMPYVKNADSFDGILMHSANFHLNDERLKDKRVIVVGNSYSGVEVASNLCGYAKSVTNIFNRPYMVLPRLTSIQTGANTFKIFPTDLLFGREVYSKKRTPLESREFKKNLFQKMCPYQTDPTRYHPSLYYELENDSDNDEPIRETFGDYYCSYVNSGLIKPMRTKIVELVSNGVQLESGEIEPADAVIFCTGYVMRNEFFDKKTLKTLKYEPSKMRVPYNLYKYTVHPDLANFAMIGQTTGLTMASIELQARWVMQLFKGEKKLEPVENVQSELLEMDVMRKRTYTHQFPLGYYHVMEDVLARECGSMPNFDKIQNFELYKMLWHNGTIPAQFGFNWNRDLAMKVMKEVADVISRVYFISNEESCEAGGGIQTNKLAQRFSKYFKLPLEIFKE